MKLINYLFIFILIFSVSVIADPPFQTSDISKTLNIVYPKEDIYQSNTIINPHFQVYTPLGLIVDNSTIVCNYHIYDSAGNHLAEQLMIYDGINFETTLNTTITNRNGQLTYNMRCQNSTIGGFDSGFLFLTPDNQPHGQRDYAVFVVFLTMLTAWILIMNMGRNIDNLRRFIGASFILVTSYGGMYVLSLTNHGTNITAEGWMVVMIGITYFVIQLGIVTRNLFQEYIKN